MANFTTMVARVQDLCGTHSLASTAVIGRFVNNRHRAFLESYPWSRRKQEVFVILLAQNTSGTFTVTNGSPTATISGGSISSADNGKYIRFQGDDEYYVVASVSGSNLTLKDLNGTTVNYQGTTNTTATYAMFQRWYSLGTAIERVISAWHDTRKLTERPSEWIDARDPKRTISGNPIHYAFGPRDQSGTNDLMRVELYPRPIVAGLVTFSILLGHTDLSGTTNPIVPSGPVEWGAAIDGCYYLYARTGDDHWTTLAERYQRELSASFEFEQAEDTKKFGQSQFIRDIYGTVPLSLTDFAVTHDVEPIY